MKIHAVHRQLDYISIQKLFDHFLFTGDKEIKSDTKGIDSDTHAVVFQKTTQRLTLIPHPQTIRQIISLHQ
jgi:hypothetical protein